MAGMNLVAYCEQCNHRHPIDLNPVDLEDRQLPDWYTKHAGHAGVGYQWRQRVDKPSWVDRLKGAWNLVRRPSGVVESTPTFRDGFREIPPSRLAAMIANADVKTAYAASASPTLTLASLAASSTLLAGRESSSISNTSNKYLDYMFAGFYKASAANNQAGSIRTAVVGATNDTPLWPDVFDGTDSAETVTAAGIYNAVCRVISDIAADNTANRVWYWGPVGIAPFFGGVIPVHFVLFVSHNIQTSTNGWSATEGLHGVSYTPVYATVT